MVAHNDDLFTSVVAGGKQILLCRWMKALQNGVDAGGGRDIISILTLSNGKK